MLKLGITVLYNLEMHIWVESFGQKSNLRRQQRILLWNCEREMCPWDISKYFGD
jgi:hypothetical protein